jgi:addiction module HigA family antidote
MIVSYRDKRTSDFAAGKRVRAFSGFERMALLKLDRMEAATSIKDLSALPAIHPGEHLAEELREMGMSAAELSRQLRVPTNRVTQILNGRRSITGDTALRLAHFFGTSAEFWLNLQGLYEIRVAQQKSGSAIKALPTIKDFQSESPRSAAY